MKILKSLQKNELQFPIEDHFMIGSHGESQLYLPGIDARQARIEKRENDYIIRDMRSQLGVFVNEVRVLEAILNDGDILRFGSHEFIFTNKDKTNSTCELTSKNELWSQQLEQITCISQSEFPVLLLGPSGSGKEVLAEAIHKESQRSSRPFVRVNCSALTETLVESELFGHIKGSFTGAVSDRKGSFETARGGTLFLDEIGDLPYSIQAKLLRALENNEIRPVGSDRTIKTDVRIIAATHKNLQDKIRNQEFRADLYYRLNVIQINAPSLIERLEDFDHILMSFARKYRVRFSFDAIQILKKHKWPGNIRELRNLVARASIVHQDCLIEENFVERLLDRQTNYSAPPVISTLPVIKEIEKQMIIKRLVANHGNQRRTASDLGMPKSTLHDKLRIYNINPQSWVELKASELPS